MNDAATAKRIAKYLRKSRFKSRAYGERVFVETSEPTWIVTDLLPPGWGARYDAKTFDRLIVQWVG